jgi:hypothetical protein
MGLDFIYFEFRSPVKGRYTIILTAFSFLRFSNPTNSESWGENLSDFGRKSARDKAFEECDSDWRNRRSR